MSRTSRRSSPCGSIGLTVPSTASSPFLLTRILSASFASLSGFVETFSASRGDDFDGLVRGRREAPVLELEALVLDPRTIDRDQPRCVGFLCRCLGCPQRRGLEPLQRAVAQPRHFGAGTERCDFADNHFALLQIGTAVLDGDLVNLQPVAGVDLPVRGKAQRSLRPLLSKSLTSILMSRTEPFCSFAVD